jgi:tetratricopeptide (TPR) repeat protein
VVKRIAVVSLALLGAWSCASVPPSTPSAYFIEDVPTDVTMRLSLDDRLAAKEAWEALRAGRAEQAGKIVARLGSTNPVYSVGLAYADLLSGDIAAAEEGFNASLQSFPDMTPARVGLAQIYESRGESDAVFNEYREILKKEPRNRWAKPRFEALKARLVQEQYDAGIGAWKGGNREAARTALLKVLFYEPDHVEAHYNLGLIYLEEDDAASALVHFQAFQSLEKNDAAFRERMTQAFRQMAGLFYQKGELGRSLELYEKLMELEPQDQEVLKRIEEIKAKLGVFELPSQYAVIPTLEAITREDLAALIGVKFEDALDAPARRTEILVDIAMSWAQRFVVKVASLEIMSVFDNHTFEPRRIINRAELAETAVRLIGVLQARGAKFVPLVEARRVQVADVSPDSHYYPSITRALALQIMSVTPERMFEPERVVSGEEATRVMDLILRLAK